MEESIREVLACNVRLLRSEHHYTQERLAEMSGTHRTYIGAIERSERNISLDMICRLAKALHVDGAELLTAQLGLVNRAHAREA